MRTSVVAAALLCLLAASFSFSQGGNSQLGGVATDPSGALLPGVTITVTNVDTSITNTAITNESGAYNFPALQPGSNYSVSASLPGFQRKTVTNLNIGTAVTVRQDFQLQIASQATSIDVNIEANELLATNSQSVGQVLTTTRVRDLPIVGNDVLSLLNVMGGVVGGQGSQNTTFAGVTADMVNTVRDGLSVSDGRFQSGVFTTNFINPDLVGEIRVILAPVDAEMGRGNGQVIINTRSGTNRYSGTAQWDIRNTALNPNTWNNNRQVNASGAWEPTVPNWSNTHHYTVSYGGPIIRNKTFFFALWDQQLQYQRNIVNANVMTDTARKGIFRYWSGWNNGNAETNTTFTGNNPTTASVDAAGNPLRPQFNPGTATNPPAYTGGLVCFSVFGNVKFDGSPVSNADCQFGSVTGTMINPGAAWDSLRPVADSTGYIAKIMSKMPTANNFTTGDGLNQVGYRFTRTRRGNSGAAVTIGTDTNTNRKQFNLKVDQNFSANHKLSVNWTHERNDSYNDQPNWPDGFAYFTIRTPQVLTANLTSTLSSTLLNEGRFGVRYSDANIAAPYEEKYYPDKSVVQEALKYTFNLNGYVTTVSPGAGAYNFGGTANGLIVQNPGQYNGNVSKLFNYADTLSWTQGKHAFKFGGEWRSTVSKGYNNIPQIPFPRIIGGGGANASPLNTAGSTPLLPAASLLATNRGNATNMLYFLAGSVNNASMLYWIDDPTDVDKGKWEDTKSLGRKFRDTVENEASGFFKDDWKIAKNLTLNLGLRWDWYGSPYIGSGFSTTSVGQGYGLWGAGLGSTSDIFANWLQPGSLYLSGYGPNAGTSGLKCTTGTSNGALLPSSTCDPSKLTTVEFIGPNTPNPNKSAFPSDMNNFGPAVGFSWNTSVLGEGHPMTVRGGYQITYGGSGRLVGGGGATSSEVILGGAPGPLSSASTQASDFSNEYLDLTDVAKLVPVRPTSPAVPGGTIDISNGTTTFSAVDPHYVIPYVQNFTFSVTTNLTRKVSLDLRYIGTVSRKQQSSVNPNLNNVYFNKEVWDALDITRAGGDAPLFDQMFAGLNLSNNTAGYGPIGTCVASATAPGAGLDGCPAGQVRQHGSAHLRRSSASLGIGQPTVQQALANGQFSLLASNLLITNGVGIPANGATGGLTNLPDTDPATPGIQGPIANAGRLLRNGCDRIAAGLYNPALAASNTNIPTRCFAENYLKINPQLGNTTFVTNGNSSNYHSVQADVTLRPTAGLSWQGTYTFSKNLGISGNATDPTNRNGDYTFTNNDRTHQFRMNGTFELPLGPNKLLLGNSSGWLARAIERWQTSVIFNWTSGAPSDISGATTFYNNGTPDIVGPFPFKSGTVRWDGPNNTAGNFHGGTYFGPAGQFISIDDPQCTTIVNHTDSMGFNLFNNGSCTINALAYANSDGTPGQIIFQTALPGHRGTLGQNVMRTIGAWNFDANLSKTFRVSESKSVQVRIDTTNVLNHPTPAAPTLDSQSANFGLIQGGGNVAKTGGRSFQGTLRFTF